LVSELEADRDLARALGQPSAAIAAIQLKARLAGLLVDRKETGAPGDFSALQSPEAVLDAVRRELGDKVAEILQASLAPEQTEALVEAVPDTSRDPGTPLN
jgi:hypothetical protein